MPKPRVAHRRTAFVPRIVLQAAFVSVVPVIALSGCGTNPGVADAGFNDVQHTVAADAFARDTGTPTDVRDVQTGVADVSFTVATDAFGVADAGFSVADAGFSVADAAFTVAADAFGVADAGFSVADAGFSVADTGFNG